MRHILTEIEIAADAETVWQALMDFEKYPEWNPFIQSIKGNTEPDEVLEVFIKPPGSRGMSFTPTVVSLEPNRLFAWQGKLLFRGLFDGRHEFRLEPNEQGTTKLTHSESFKGILVPVLWKMIRKGTERGFEEMNLALKNRIESGN
ncbi:MAG: SRPBCC domain-containing protein [Acidobacteria bacterium]|nr:SRPBCC domain-containing protein [Acidobacteriota bacterium]